MDLKTFATLGPLLIVGLGWAQEDSLRSALNAIDRRQKDLSDLSRYDDTLGYGYSLDSPDDLAFLSPPDYNSDEDPRSSHDDDVKKRMSSSFRERLEEDKERQLEQLAQNVLESERDNSEEGYSELIRELWDKYRNYPNLYSHPKVYFNEKKRMYYPRLGLDSVGLRRRDPYYQEMYNPNFLNKYHEDDDDDDENYEWARNKYQRMERFPVSKRSSNDVTHEHKRSTTKKDCDKTDPKVAKDLSNIFGSATTPKPEKTKAAKKEQEEQKTKKKATTKEEVAEVVSDKPLQIQKKSINWSDYFGLDRRKKSEDELDKEWLIERYHKAIALKRNAEYPLHSFKNHDKPSKKESVGTDQISDMDAKLKNMEDTIIDDALKYTGAHEGTTDSQEIQEVKDRVISRLAAAYSLEKMRQALGEYKLSVNKERNRLKHQHKVPEDYDISEEKRVSVPRKQAVDDDRIKIPEGDNNIKCSHGDEDCDELNYRTPSDVLDQTVFEECPRVQRACSEIAAVLGHHARVFEAACNMHQMCLLCSNNSWFAPTRQCNVLFLTKAFELCDDKEDCQKEAQRSVRYLLDVNRSLRLEPLEECELACPDRR